MKIKINNKFYDFFDEVNVNLSLDTIASAFSFKARFNPQNIQHQLLFQPLIYSKVEIFTNDDKLMFTGLIVNNQFASSSSTTLAILSGYSLTGVLEDSTIPYSGYPLEKNNVSLNDVTRGLLADFDLNFVVDSNVTNDMNLNYKKTHT